MSRKEILSKLMYSVPVERSVRVIIMTDLANEADDPYAVIHMLLSPTLDVKGIVAGHFEHFPKMIDNMLKEQGVPAGLRSEKAGDLIPPRGGSVLRSMDVGKALLDLTDMQEIPLLQGSRFELNAWADFSTADEEDRFPSGCWQTLADGRIIPASAGADLIIEEAMKEDPRPLFVTTLGGVTDLAIAVLKRPEIAGRMTAIVNGGEAYPAGGGEFNFLQDIPAINLLLESELPIWQIPSNAYSATNISLARLQREVRPCGKVGSYLFDETVAFHRKTVAQNRDFASEGWCLGDNSVVYALLMPDNHLSFHEEDAPFVRDDLTYGKRANTRKIRVIDKIDPHYILTDLIDKLTICYSSEVSLE